MSGAALSPLPVEEAEQLKWLAENARAVFEHYSSLRVQITVLNVTAIGAFSVFDAPDGGGGDARSIVALTIFAVAFGLLAARLSAVCAYHWGLYQKCRNRLALQFATAHEIRTSTQAVRNLGTRMSNLNFWPVINIGAPVAAICLHFLPE